jgi:hypothetical protein
MAVSVADLLAVILLAEDGIRHDDASFQNDRFQQLQSRFVLVGSLVHPPLTQDVAGLLIEQRQQMHAFFMRRKRAAQRLAIDRNRLKLPRDAGEVQPLQQVHPARQHGFERDRTQRHQQVAKAIPRRRLAREAHPMPGGGFLKTQPLSDGPITARTAQNRTNNRRQHGGQTMATSLLPTRIRNLRQFGQQAPRGTGLQNSLLQFESKASGKTTGILRPWSSSNSDQPCRARPADSSAGLCNGGRRRALRVFAFLSGRHWISSAWGTFDTGIVGGNLQWRNRTRPSWANPIRA